MKSWEEDKRWSDNYLTDIKRILGEHLIGEPPVEEDQERNTDLMVLKMDAVRIGCRLRRFFPHYERYNHQFTIRAGRPSGYKTELTKIIEGWGDYFFYGFTNEKDTELYAWGLADLKTFRLWFNRQLVINKGGIPGEPQNNNDGSSSFIAFNWWDMPDDFIVSSSNIKTAL